MGGGRPTTLVEQTLDSLVADGALQMVGSGRSRGLIRWGVFRPGPFGAYNWFFFQHSSVNH